MHNKSGRAIEQTRYWFLWVRELWLMLKTCTNRISTKCSCKTSRTCGVRVRNILVCALLNSHLNWKKSLVVSASYFYSLCTFVYVALIICIVFQPLNCIVLSARMWISLQYCEIKRIYSSQDGESFEWRMTYREEYNVHF